MAGAFLMLKANVKIRGPVSGANWKALLTSRLTRFDLKPNAIRDHLFSSSTRGNGLFLASYQPGPFSTAASVLWAGIIAALTYLSPLRALSRLRATFARCVGPFR